MSSETEAVHRNMQRMTSDGGQARSYGWDLLGEGEMTHRRNPRLIVAAVDVECVFSHSCLSFLMSTGALQSNP